MTHIKFSNVHVEFPIFNAGSRTFTGSVFRKKSNPNSDLEQRGKVTVRALSGLDFNIQSGERVALLGDNGAGKSTLLRSIGGIFGPKSGKIEVQGKISSLIDISLGIEPEATGIENIFTRGMLLGMSKKYLASKVDEIVEFSDLADFINMPVRTYSSGMQMRLGFSISTIIKPEILIMDEWLSVGDEQFKAKAEARLEQLLSESEILIIATHSRELAEKLCTRAILLGRGKVIADGETREITQRYFQQ